MVKNIRAPLLCILIMSALVHFWRLDVPREVVFDEVHYGKFLNAYLLSGERFFDVHPPLPKLIMALAAKIAGLKEPFTFERIGLPYGDLPVFWLRFFPALIGTLLPVLFFWILIEMAVTPATALLGGLIMVFENATLVQTRFMLLDGFLVFGILGTVLGCLRARSGSFRWAALAGTACAIAISTKFTGLVCLAAPMVWVFRWNRKRLVQFGLFILACLAFYFLIWKVHFVLLTLPGFGDAFSRPSGRFFPDLWALHQEMLRANSRIAPGHPDASPWWTWPWLRTPPFYWTKGSAFIYLFGNPFIWWGGAAALVSLASHGLLRTRRAARLSINNNLLWYPALLYLGSFVPLAFIKRPLFLYHYLPSLWLSSLMVMAWFEQIGLLPKWRKVFLALAVLGFLAAAPITYGLTVPPEYVRLLYWRPEFFWRY